MIFKFILERKLFQTSFCKRRCLIMLIILIILLKISLYTYTKKNKDYFNNNLALRDENYEIRTCFTTFNKTKHLYICGRNHHLVSQLNQQNFQQQIDSFLNIFYYRIDNFVMDGSINSRFSLWSFLRILQPTHVIESGANKGYGTWLIRQALPKSRITVVTPKTPKSYIDKSADTKYYSGTKFKDFKNMKWLNENIDYENTVVYFDDHQSVYERIKQAKVAGFKHIIFDDNYLPGSTKGLNNNLSLRQACDFGECLVSLSKDFKTQEYVDNFGKVRKPFKTNSKLLENIKEELNEFIKVIYEPYYLCDILEYPKSRQEIVTHKIYRNTVKSLLNSKQCVSLKRNLNLLDRSFLSYTNLVYVQL